MVENCILSCTDNFDLVISLGVLPLGFPVNNPSDNPWSAELVLQLNSESKLCRTINRIPYSNLAEENLYRSESYKVIKDHDEEFVNYILNRYNISNNNLLVEIGCSDGSQLNKFQERGFTNLVGIDPALHSGVNYEFEVIKSFFDQNTIDIILKKRGIPKLLYANYVLELIPDIDLFFKDIKKILKEDSYFIFEVPSFVDYLQTSRIDGFAHLRCYWFTLHSLVYAAKKYGFQIYDFEYISDYRGGTLRICYTLRTLPKESIVNKRINQFINNEKEYLNRDYLRLFRNKVNTEKNKILLKIRNLYNLNKTVAVYGAGLKASVILNWLNLKNDTVSFSLDQDRNKHNKFIPITNIPILDPKKLSDYNSNEIVIINLAVDHAEEIKAFLRKILSSGSIIVDLVPEYNEEII